MPTPSYSIVVRVELGNKPGMLGKVASAIGRSGGDIGAVDITGRGQDTTIRDIVIDTRDEKHKNQIIRKLRTLSTVKILNIWDRTFISHIGGKIEVVGKLPLETRDHLSIAYTPGVARISEAISADKQRAYQLTIKSNTVAVVTDGSAVLGLGNVGAEAAIPVMEGKALLFKKFGGIDAFPICLATQDVEEIIQAVHAIAPVFGGINLEDISAPRCFEIEERLKEDLDIPVFHDDQHATAVVMLAGLINALAVVGKKMKNLKVVVNGVGVAGVACTKILKAAGVEHIIGCDRSGIICRGRKKGMNPVKRAYARITNPDNLRGGLSRAIRGADVFVGVSQPGVLKLSQVRTMAKDSIVFAMANPYPEIMPEKAAPYVRVMATGRSDYPNQINNVLAFPGIFKGALACHAGEINEQMKLVAAHAIAESVPGTALHEDYVVPSVFNEDVAGTVADTVEKAAIETGVARRY
ncbi:MAG: NAD-dependent malic enzyme [Desulfobacterales bacterium]|nr:NAD-dependent malic enzyme [Desulfobacterales bacterium]